MKELCKDFVTHPAVFLIENTYQIMVPVNKEAVTWVEVGNIKYYDYSNGILRSQILMHKITIPTEGLNIIKKYVICYRIVNERKPYFSDLSDEYRVKLLMWLFAVISIRWGYLMWVRLMIVADNLHQ